MNPIDMDGLAIERVHVGSFELFTDFGGHTHGPQVIGVDETDDVVDLRARPSPFERSESGLSRKSVTPA